FCRSAAEIMRAEVGQLLPVKCFPPLGFLPDIVTYPTARDRFLDEAAFPHSALRPVNSSHLRTITSAYNGSSSIRKARRPVRSAAIKVDPLPPKRSRTFSPARDEYCIARSANATGFSVRCTMLCGLIFLTGHTSTALLGPKNWCPAPSRHP